MFQNYINVALRNLIKHKLYSAINILGLAVGLAACILITLFVRDELSYDKFWKEADQIQRLHTTFNIPGREPFVTVVSMGPAKAALERYYGEEIEAVTRMNINFNPVVKYGDKLFSETVIWTDPETADIFDFKVLKGDLRQSLSDNSSIAIDSELATKYFGDEDPIGKALSLKVYNIDRDFTVGAVYEKLPSNTVLVVPAMVKINEEDFRERYSFLFNQWFSVNNHTFFKLKKGVKPELVSSRFNSFADENIPFNGAAFGKKDAKASEFIHFSSVPMVKLQHTPSGMGAFKPTGDIKTVVIFSSIAVLILLIACINFMNLATAKSTQRSKEVALRKVLGAKRSQLIFQFLSESLVLAFIGMILSVAIVELTLPMYSNFLERDLMFNYADPLNMVTLVGLIMMVGLVAGIYPALILSGFRPASILKANKSAETRGSVLFRNILVVIQFTISIGLIIGALVVFAQRYYATNMDPGYTKENLLTVFGMTRQGAGEKKDAFRAELEKMADVKLVAYSADTPSNSNEANRSVTLPGDASNQTILIGTQTVDYDYFRTYEIALVAGRVYQKDQALDQFPSARGVEEGKLLEGNVIINEMAVKRLGFGNPHDAIGKTIRTQASRTHSVDLKVIGVVADTHFQSLKQVTRPELYLIQPAGQRAMTIRFEGNGLAFQKKVEDLWRRMIPDVPFLSGFVDEAAEAEFREENNLAVMLGVFSGLAVLVACLGLYGLASFTAVRRTKEIGIRKVMGARVFDIVKLLIWQFSKPVILANLVAWPLAIWGASNWLQSFPIRFDLIWLLPMSLGASFVAVLIAWGTVGGNAAKVARSNPIKALRYE